MPRVIGVGVAVGRVAGEDDVDAPVSTFVAALSALPLHAAIDNATAKVTNRSKLDLIIKILSTALIVRARQNPTNSSFLRRQEPISIFVNLLNEQENKNGPLPAQG